MTRVVEKLGTAAADTSVRTGARVARILKRAADGESFAITWLGKPIGHARNGKIFFTYRTFPPVEITEQQMRLSVLDRNYDPYGNPFISRARR
jgi:hypothetical protein